MIGRVTLQNERGEEVELYKILKNIIEETGRPQTWVANKVNAICPSVNMSVKTLNAALHGRRKISGDEFLALCRVLEINPDSIADMVINK